MEMHDSTNKKDTLPQYYLIVSYFALCFIIAWSIWIPAGMFAPDTTILVLPGAWAPTIAALLLTWFSEGRVGVGKLLRGLFRWRVSAKYYVFAVFSVLGITVLAIVIHILLGGLTPEVGAIAVQFGIPKEKVFLFIAILPFIFITTIFIGGPIAEELGWRGYAQPRLQAQLGAGFAGLIIGFVWSLWHLPLFYYFPSAVGEIPVGHYIPLVSALGVLFAWLYNRTGGSVLLCILLHAGVNFTLGVIGKDILTTDSRVLTIFVVLMGLLAFFMSLQIRSVRGIHSSSQ